MNELEQQLKSIKEEKEAQVQALIEQVKASENITTNRELLFFLVENFRSATIFPFLQQLIHEEKYKHYNGFLVYLCGECSLYDCSNEVEFFIHLIAENDGEVAMTAYNILLDAENIIEFTEEKIQQWLAILHQGQQKNPTLKYLKHAINWLKED